MARHEDSEEIKALKKKLTQDFINAVESSGTEMGPKELEYQFNLGGKIKKGIIWCAYRRGERSMYFPTLREKISNAVKKGLITKMKGDKLLSQLPPLHNEVSQETIKPAGEPYTFDASLLFQSDVSRTTELLVKQITELRKRITYGNKQLEDVHFYTTSLDILDPVQILIQKMLHEKQAEESRLNIEFGNDNYKEIEPIPSSRKASAEDVGYTPDWWTRSPPSIAEMDEIRCKTMMSDEVIRKRKAFIALNGNDGVDF